MVVNALVPSDLLRLLRFFEAARQRMAGIPVSPSSASNLSARTIRFGPTPLRDTIPLPINTVKPAIQALAATTASRRPPPTLLAGLAASYGQSLGSLSGQGGHPAPFHSLASTYQRLLGNQGAVAPTEDPAQAGDSRALAQTSDRTGSSWPQLL